jgi:hypothetical protein
MVRAFRAFLEFCYIARRNVLTDTSLNQLRDAVDRFHHYRIIFQTTGVRPDGFSLPRQHSISHYHPVIRLFGAPNGLCSSITEAKHIKAVKEPWRRSNRHQALGQILLTNQRLDKLAASRVDFTSRGMLQGTCLTDVVSQTGKPHTLSMIFSSVDTLFSEDDHAGDPNMRRAVSGPDHRGVVVDNDDINGVDDGPRVLAHVDLAKTARA